MAVVKSNSIKKAKKLKSIIKKIKNKQRIARRTNFKKKGSSYKKKLNRLIGGMDPKAAKASAFNLAAKTGHTTKGSIVGQSTGGTTASITMRSQSSTATGLPSTMGLSNTTTTSAKEFIPASNGSVTTATANTQGAPTLNPLPSLTLENYEDFIKTITDNWNKFFADNGFEKKNDFLDTLGKIGSEGPNTMIRKQLVDSKSKTLLDFKFNLIHIVENIILGMTPEPRNLLREIEYYLLLLGLQDYPPWFITCLYKEGSLPPFNKVHQVSFKARADIFKLKMDDESVEMETIIVKTAHKDIEPELLDVVKDETLYISKDGLAEYKIYIASEDLDLKMYMCKIVREDGEVEYIEGYVPAINLVLDNV
jgi:hypothetical protein